MQLSGYGNRPSLGQTNPLGVVSSSVVVSASVTGGPAVQQNDEKITNMCILACCIIKWVAIIVNIRKIDNFAYLRTQDAFSMATQTKRSGSNILPLGQY